MAGYGFEDVPLGPHASVSIKGLLLSMMVPFAALMIPLFTLMASFDMLDTHMAVILPTVASAYFIFYFRQSTKAFPSELREPPARGWAQGMADLPLRLCAGDAVDLCGSFHHRFHGAWNAFCGR
jgi:hypothetical protein